MWCVTAELAYWQQLEVAMNSEGGHDGYQTVVAHRRQEQPNASDLQLKLW